MEINGYEVIGTLQTDNSGTAKWGFARKNGQTVFIKEFLSPVYPYDESKFSEQSIISNKKICMEFEESKRKLYDVLAECKNGGVVYVTDFFRHKSKYYMVTPKIEMSSITPENIYKLDLQARIMICRVIAYNMISIHKRGIIHADIKPDNIIIKETIPGVYTAKIIDFDSSFFETNIPSPDDLQCDTVYLAPEAFMYMCEENESISVKIDIYALGILFCQYLTGDVPEFNKEEYTYLYAAILDDSDVSVNSDIPENLKELLMKMISKNPDDRPDIDDVFDSLVLKECDNEISPEENKINTVNTGKKKGFKTASHTL